ncbi:hypothetical protein PRZ48_009540 [Zasmidium cellare]|uniref:RING-type domain-containing protein n=1 Tax=Zasmidium cellare TaxID=395010 RepID=A0ABR0ED76_ZASCE|nr:hypothetical protein PRZ48_009540 [Zasmidium cellare]
MPVDCVCEECLEFQREYCHVLNLVEQYEKRPKMDRRLQVAAGQLYEAWLELQHSPEHKFVARQKAELRDQYKEYSMPFEFPEKPLECFCWDCYDISWMRYALALARLPDAERKHLDMFRDQLRIQHAPGHVFVSRKEQAECDPTGRELLGICRSCESVTEDWAVFPCGHRQCFMCMIHDRIPKRITKCIECQQDAPFVLITRCPMKSACDEKDTYKRFCYTPETKEDEVSTKYMKLFGFDVDNSGTPTIDSYPTRAYANYLRQFGIIAEPELIDALRVCMLSVRYQCAYDFVDCTHISHTRDDWKTHLFKAHGEMPCEDCMDETGDESAPKYRPEGRFPDSISTLPFDLMISHQAKKHGFGSALRTIVQVWREYPMQFYYWSPETMGLTEVARHEDLFKLAMGKLVRGAFGELTEEDISPPEEEPVEWDGWKSRDGNEEEEDQETVVEEVDEDKTKVEETQDFGIEETEDSTVEDKGETDDQALKTGNANAARSDSDDADEKGEVGTSDRI